MVLRHPSPPARPSAARGQRPKPEARHAQRDAHAAPAGRAPARLGGSWWQTPPRGCIPDGAVAQ